MGEESYLGGGEDAKCLKLVQEVLHQGRHSPYVQEPHQLPNDCPTSTNSGSAKVKVGTWQMIVVIALVWSPVVRQAD